MRTRLPAALLAALSLSVVAAAQSGGGARGAGQGGGPSFASTLVGAADANGDGAVTAAEWQAFTHALHASDQESAPVDVDALLGRVVAVSFDLDGDGTPRVSELGDALAALDADGDGALAADELAGARGGARRGRGLSAAFALGIVVPARDLDGDGALSARERQALLEDAGAADAPIPDAAASAWVRTVLARPSEDRTAFTPGVVLLSMRAALDADQDGRVTSSDLAALFRGLDADADGSVSAQELRPARRGGGQGSAQGGGQAAGEVPFQRVTVQQRDEPPLVAWQRNLEDALALVQSSGKPLLICVNMDGESASESLAWYRYRDPAFAALTERFVPLIVSPDRHGTLDYDDRGRRLVDPRFGRVVCSEHVDIEPRLYERYFNGTRVAPRHVGVAPDGTILFDLYLLQDLSEIDRKLEEHGLADAVAREAEEPAGQATEATEDEPEPELAGARTRGFRARRLPLDNPDAADRARVEAEALDPEWRRRFRVASTALDSERKVQHPDALRLTLRDEDGRVRRQAVWTALREVAWLPPALQAEALRVSAEDPVLRGALTGAFGRLARTARDEAQKQRAARLHRVFAGLGERSALVDAATWRAALEGAEADSEEPLSVEALDPLLEEVADLEAQATAAPEDGALRVLMAERLTRLGRLLFQLGQDPSAAFEDARAAARKAEDVGAGSGRTAVIEGYAAYMLGEPDAAAERLARALPALLEEAATPLAALALHTFAQLRTRALYASLGAGSEFPPSWVADVRAAYEALLAHPAGTAAQAVELLAVLEVLEARAEQGEAVLLAARRFPESADVHAWLRTQRLRDAGAAALEAAYADLVPQVEDGAALRWFHGLAHFVAAERQVGNRAPEEALAAYARSIERFAAAQELDAEVGDSARHYVGLAQAARARLFADAGRWDEAAAALRATAEARPESASTPDGLGVSPAESALAVLRAMAAAGRAEQAQALRAELSALGFDLSTRRGGD